jgi:cold shock CspA family protein
MPIGTVLSFNDILGEGVIESDTDSTKIFVSYREIKKTGYKILTEGQHVKFEIFKGKKGRIYAKNVIID